MLPENPLWALEYSVALPSKVHVFNSISIVSNQVSGLDLSRI